MTDAQSKGITALRQILGELDSAVLFKRECGCIGMTDADRRKVRELAADIYEAIVPQPEESPTKEE
jgi:hypothetical protein